MFIMAVKDLYDAKQYHLCPQGAPEPTLNESSVFNKRQHQCVVSGTCCMVTLRFVVMFSGSPAARSRGSVYFLVFETARLSCVAIKSTFMSEHGFKKPKYQHTVTLFTTEASHV